MLRKRNKTAATMSSDSHAHFPPAMMARAET